MKVELWASTQFFSDAVREATGWETDASGGQALVEAAGRACYQSWSKPNPATATNEGYLEHIIDVGHYSVLEHGILTFYIAGVSRSLTHELVRHRHFSYSQLSQRFVNELGRSLPVIPPLYENQDAALEIISDVNEKIEEAYGKLVDYGVDVLGEKRKQAREAARSVLPNATETRIVVTGNYRAWRHFLKMRGAEGADKEIRKLAVNIYNVIVSDPRSNAINVFSDVTKYRLEDGSFALSVGKSEDA